MNVKRRNLLAGAATALISPYLSVAAADERAEDIQASPQDIRAWMNAWIDSPAGETRRIEGLLYLARFLDPYYVLLKPISWSPLPSAPPGFKKLTVPRGFVTDLTSVPRVFWSALRPDGEYSFAAIVHDYLYWTQSTSREQADEILRMAMQELGIEPSVIRVIYNAVRLGGDAAWRQNAQLRLDGERRVLKILPTDPRTRWSDWKTRPTVFR